MAEFAQTGWGKFSYEPQVADWADHVARRATDVAQDPVDAMSEYLLEALEEIPPKQIERRQTMNPKLSATRSRSYRMMKRMSIPADTKFKDA